MYFGAWLFNDVYTKTPVWYFKLLSKVSHPRVLKRAGKVSILAFFTNLAGFFSESRTASLIRMLYHILTRHENNQIQTKFINYRKSFFMPFIVKKGESRCN